MTVVYYEAFKKFILNSAKHIDHHLEEQKKLQNANGGRFDGMLTPFTEFLGLNDLFDNEWKRILALTMVMSILAFFGALIGTLFFGPSITEEEEDERRGGTNDCEDDYFWELPTDSTDGGNALFLRDVFTIVKPHWFFSNPALSKDTISFPFELYELMVSKEHWIKSHKFRFPFSLHSLLLTLFPLAVDLRQTKPAQLDALFATKASHFLNVAFAQQLSDLNLVKKSLGLLETDQFLCFVDLVFQRIVLVVRNPPCSFAELIKEEEEKWSDLAKEISKQMQTLELKDEFKLFSWIVTGQGIGGSVAAIVAKLIQQQQVVECYVFGSPPVSPNLALGSMTHFVFERDVLARSSLFSLEQFFKLCVTLDGLDGVDFATRLKWMRKRALPQEVQALLFDSMKGENPKYFPGPCYWCFGKELLELPSSQIISTQPMFVDDSWWTSLDMYQTMFVEET